MLSRRSLLQSGAAAAAYAASGTWPARAANAPGVTDTEIKIGQTMPYSGPASAYGMVGRTEAAYFKMINEMGGINGRKLNLISVDDGYSPPKTVEQTRRLVEQEQVAFIFQSLGTTNNLAIRGYLNDNKIPQLFIATADSMFSDPQHYPWTLPFGLGFRTEARIFGKHIRSSRPDAKIGVIYESVGGEDARGGLREGLGTDHTAMIVKEVSYEVTDPTVDSQVVTLQGSGADTLLILATPKAAAQTIRKAYDLGWRPERYMSYVSSFIAALKPAGLDTCKGLITGAWGKDPNDPRWKDDPGYKEYAAFITKYMTPADISELSASYGFSVASLLVHVLEQCGNDLSRENILRQATNIRDVATPMALPGMTFYTSPDDYRGIRQLQLARFNGLSWELFGDLISD